MSDHSKAWLRGSAVTEPVNLGRPSMRVAACLELRAQVRAAGAMPNGCSYATTAVQEPFFEAEDRRNIAELLLPTTPGLDAVIGRGSWNKLKPLLEAPS